MGIIRDLMNGTLYETDMLAILTILISMSAEKQTVFALVQMKYPPVLVRELQSFNPPVGLGAAKILANCLSVDEEVDKEFVNAGIIQAFENLFEKQKIKEYSKLREKVTFMIGNLLCSSPWVFEQVCNSSLINRCVNLLGDDHSPAVILSHTDQNEPRRHFQDCIYQRRR